MRVVNNNIDEAIESGTELREIISEIFEIPRPERIVLTPSILAGLNILFSSLRANKISLSLYEYYDEYHFPNMKVASFDLEKVVEHVKQVCPEVVLISVVTWLGKKLSVNDLFGQIRSAMGKGSPILIADCAHVGAIGFPALSTIDADIICGDICKWITPPEWQRNLAFLWFREQSFWDKAARAFRPFYLATQQERKHLLARWIDPSEVRTVVSWLKERRLDRARLLRRHQCNMELATKLGHHFGLTKPPESSILLIDDESKTDILFSELMQNGLAWAPPTGGLRVLCRAEAAPALSLVADVDSLGEKQNAPDPSWLCL
jgi:hypothetical protein